MKQDFKSFLPSEDHFCQDILAPNKFTKNCDCVAVSEEMLAEGMVRHPPKHPHAKDLVSNIFLKEGKLDCSWLQVSSVWGSYFFHPEPEKKKKGEKILSRASSFAKRKMSTGEVKDAFMLPLLIVFLARTFGGKI